MTVNDNNGNFCCPFRKFSSRSSLIQSDDDLYYSNDQISDDQLIQDDLLVDQSDQSSLYEDSQQSDDSSDQSSLHEANQQSDDSSDQTDTQDEVITTEDVYSYY